MKSALPRILCRPSTLAIAFIPIPLVLALSFPASFWAISDYEPHSLANALNMAYRLADLKMYTPMEMSYHPGVPFYLMSWLALALTGHPLGSDGVALFNTMVDHIETFHLMMIFLAGLVGAAGIFIFARTAPGSSRATYYTYRSPFAQFGEGFVIDFASIPRLTEAYLESRPNALNTLTASKSSKEKEVGTYVIDKKYFGSADLVQNAPNLDLLGSKPVRYREGDRVIELKTVFLLVRG